MPGGFSTPVASASSSSWTPEEDRLITRLFVTNSKPTPSPAHISSLLSSDSSIRSFFSSHRALAQRSADQIADRLAQLEQREHATTAVEAQPGKIESANVPNDDASCSAYSSPVSPLQPAAISADAAASLLALSPSPPTTASDSSTPASAAPLSSPAGAPSSSVLQPRGPPLKPVSRNQRIPWEPEEDAIVLKYLTHARSIHAINSFFSANPVIQDEVFSCLKSRTVSAIANRLILLRAGDANEIAQQNNKRQKTGEADMSAKLAQSAMAPQSNGSSLHPMLRPSPMGFGPPHTAHLPPMGLPPIQTHTHNMQTNMHAHSHNTHPHSHLPLSMGHILHQPYGAPSGPPPGPAFNHGPIAGPMMPLAQRPGPPPSNDAILAILDQLAASVKALENQMVGLHSLVAQVWAEKHIKQ